MPIAVQAGLRVRKLALHSNRSYCYAFRSRAALSNTNTTPATAIINMIMIANMDFHYSSLDKSFSRLRSHQHNAVSFINCFLDAFAGSVRFYSLPAATEKHNRKCAKQIKPLQFQSPAAILSQTEEVT